MCAKSVARNVGKTKSLKNLLELLVLQKYGKLWW